MATTCEPTVTPGRYGCAVVQLLLVRHAQSAWNEQRRWQGRADPPLSDLGVRQAATAGARLGTVDAIVSSPLERAHHTAQILANAVGVGPVVLEPDLVERDVGEWSGLTRAEIEAQWPDFLDSGRRPPGFEADEVVLARAHAAIDRLVTAFGAGTILVVTHGGLIGTLERHHGESGGRTPNLAGRTFSVSSSGISLGERMALLDDDEQTVPVSL
jgi:broad specificity phosphatase PhoE